MTAGPEFPVSIGGISGSLSEPYHEQGDTGIDFYTISKTVHYY